VEKELSAKKSTNKTLESENAALVAKLSEFTLKF
jgi:hypothetical protein